MRASQSAPCTCRGPEGAFQRTKCLASLVPSNPPDFLRDLSYSYFGIASIGASKWNRAGVRPCENVSLL
ncbi:hypothetical protein EHI48_29435 [Rhizobium sp. WSM1325]|nr:hypothetical protein EHI43_12455 [Rhizobium leguminosarum]RWY68173.1 hypothetical protein EHI48_29435 [Rhizobium leguminosarum]